MRRVLINKLGIVHILRTLSGSMSSLVFLLEVSVSAFLPLMVSHFRITALASINRPFDFNHLGDSGIILRQNKKVYFRNTQT
jgi:hypothetical protein